VLHVMGVSVVVRMQERTDVKLRQTAPEASPVAEAACFVQLNIPCSSEHWP
jgi:hypothetical protein